MVGWVHLLSVPKIPELPIGLTRLGNPVVAPLIGLSQYAHCGHLEKFTLSAAVHTLFTTRLDYCNTFYVGMPLKMVWAQC